MVVTRRKKPEIAGDDATTPNASVKEDAAAAGAEEACVEVKGDEGHRAAKRAKHTTDKFAHLPEKSTSSVTCGRHGRMMVSFSCARGTSSGHC